MRSVTRTEVYWRDGRLFPITSVRPSGRGPWPKATSFSHGELVAFVEGYTGDIEILEGPAATPERVNDALLFHRGIEPSSVSSSVWSKVPEAVRQAIAAKVHQAEVAISSTWSNLSNEEARTGAFFSNLHGTFAADGWRIEMSFVEFSKQVKEPKTGTDVAVVLDAASQDGQRSFKTIWLQAKSMASKPDQSSRPARLADQLPLAHAFCEASFGLAYTPYGVFALGTPLHPQQAFGALLDDAMRCLVGDMSPTTLKNSLNRKRIFQVFMTEGFEPKRRLVLRGR